MVPLDQRSRSTPEMAEAIREEIRRIPGLASLDIRPENPMGALMTGGQKPVTVQVLGSDFAEMERAAARIGEILETVPGVVDVNVALTEKKPELHVAVDRLRAARPGLNMAMIADGVRTGFYGKPVTKYRAGGDEMDVFLRLKDEDKDDPGDLAAMPLTSMTGAQVQVGNFAEVKEGLGPIEINRLNKQRLITVGAHYKGRPLGEIITEVEEKIGAEDFPPGLGIQFGGDIKQQKETSEDLLLMLIMAIVMVYLVMSAQSFLDPLVIMLSIPFAFTGVFLLLFLADEALSLPAALGLIMLMGVVVNNAIIFVDYAKLLRREGESLEDALMLAGQRRLRPILMTAFTTIGGMLPLALSHGEGHEMWRPMGIAVIGGLLFSTVTTLILIPVVYSSVEWLRRGEPARGGEETEPAGIEVSGSAA